MKIACLDFEGVLVPEIWIALAERSGIEDLKVTTRDIPDYDELMRYRLEVVAKRGLRFSDIYDAAASLDPLPGAIKFLSWLRSRCQIVIVSDTFHEVAQPLIAKLGDPMILCHRLEISSDGSIVGYRLRQDDPKRRVVIAFQSLNYGVLAAGDSYNDISMLEQADYGVLFRPSPNVVEDYPSFQVASDYEQLQGMLAGVVDQSE